MVSGVMTGSLRRATRFEPRALDLGPGSALCVCNMALVRRISFTPDFRWFSG